MRYLCIHKADATTEAGLPPRAELLEGIGPLLEDMQKAGVFRSAEGLRPSSTGVRLSFSKGKRTLTKGPFTGGNELVAGFLLVQVETLDDAVDWASRFAEAVGDVEIDVRPLTEYWDIGVVPKPAGLRTTRFMLAFKADERFEAGAPPSPRHAAELEKLTSDMRREGVLLAYQRLQPSSKSVRLHYKGGKRTATDGPFTESKELIAGYAEVEVKSRAEAIEWSSRFARLIGDVEIDVRPAVEV